MLLLLFSSVATGEEAWGVAIEEPRICGTAEFYSSVLFACKACPDGQFGDPCRCPVGSVGPECAACNVTSLSDSSQCTTCATTCDCDNLVERDTTGAVVPKVCVAAPEPWSVPEAHMSVLALYPSSHELYPFAATGCAYHDGSPSSDRACNALINLCALDDSEACRLAEDLGRLKDPNGKRAKYVATFELDGTFVGFDDLTTQFYFGRERPPRTDRLGLGATKWLRAGTNFEDRFEGAFDEPVFYELYDEDWRAVPVKAYGRRARFFLRDETRYATSLTLTDELDVSYGSSGKVDFKVEYTSEMNRGLFIGLLVAASIASLAFRSPFAVVGALTMVAFGISTYYMVYVKFADNLLPSNETPFQTLVVVLFVLQTLAVLTLLKPRRLALIDWGGTVWRSILVANELAELQTKRRTSLAFTLAWLCFVLKGLGLEQNASPQPRLDDRWVHFGSSKILTFANLAWWFLIFTSIQLLYYEVVRPYFIDAPNKRFVELCALSTVSLFGDDFYVHGDTDDWGSREFRLQLAPNFKKAYDTVSAELLPTFLKTFLGHGYKDKFKVDFVVGTRADAGTSLFIPDVRVFAQRWLAAVSFLGHEPVLLCHEFLTLATVAILAGDTAVAAFATFLVAELVAFLRITTSNLAEATGVDSRFFI